MATQQRSGATPRRQRNKQQQAELGAAMAVRYSERDLPSIKAVADEFGVSYGTAYRLMKDADVTFRTHGGSRGSRVYRRRSASASPQRRS